MSERISKCPALFTRIHHFRGHSVHSPFAYSLVRNVLMEKSLAEGLDSVCDRLCSKGISRKYAIRISNLTRYCALSDIAVDSRTDIVNNSSILLVASPAFPEGNLLSLEQTAGPSDVFCVTVPRKGKTRRNICTQLIQRHDGLSIENRGVLLMFYDKGLNKQHIRL